MSILNEIVGRKINRTTEEEIREKRIEEGKVSFRKFCNYMNPSFFSDSRAFQDTLCTTLQQMYD